MKTNYIEQVIKDIEEVLTSPDSQLTTADKNKLIQTKNRLQQSLAKTPTGGLTEQEKSAIIQALLIVMEVLKCVAEHYK